MAQCGAKTRQGHPCKLPAGHGTDHLGEGRCKFHGGASKGGPEKVKFKKKNKAAEKHGIYTKYLPEETLELFEQEISPIDMLWQSIMLQWAAIIRAQKIMHVKTEKDHAILKSGFTEGASTSESFEVRFAFERQESFLNAQSRGLTTLARLMKQYEEALNSELATEEQKQRIAKLKAQVEILTGAGEEYEDLSETLEEVYG